ncbi:MAG: ADP-ribosylglycohydrolase family protein [Armatimonadota bacterium]|nr:ADP-ribosylglycohydrolase family protein [Armatimonadota bacterium]MCX7776741.1 ADP-ribosylglycohydrolase family protein [Armatimonadota bacterium]MDW8024539.1 ADP-ribosylglycohydrolase family protein [Armatimonadota bacterium]
MARTKISHAKFNGEGVFLIVLACVCAAILWLSHSIGACSKANVLINEAEFVDKVYACWLGKTIGGTLGMPFEGKRQMHNLVFYEPVPKEPVPNDDLDLQLLWLKALEERGPMITSHDLAQYWVKHVVVDWNEYGICKANLRLGLLPPLSGHFRNRWRHSNGAWIRSEIWACLFPGLPALAARYAFEDACVDHGVAEGTYAEVFTATLQSAAFVERDRDKLLNIALSYIPKDCGVAKSVMVAIDSWRKGLHWKTAREAVVEASKETGWFMAPQNVAFVVLGWLYGQDDFGRAICTAVNCGDDTDCTGATLGALLGILNGSDGIPKKWREPISGEIRNIAVGGFNPPRTLTELTERVVRMAKLALKAHDAEVSIAQHAPTTPNAASKLKLVDERTIKELWDRTPFQIRFRFGNIRAVFDYLDEPIIEAGVEREVILELSDEAGKVKEVTVEWRFGDDIAIKGRKSTVKLPGVVKATLLASHITSEAIKGEVEIATHEGGALATIPVVMIGRLTTHRGNFALAKYGVKATSDSELDWERGCTQKVNDGIIATEDDFEGKRWHSALTPHPHWVALHLPEVRTLGRVIIHFADPRGHPVDFDGEVSLDGQTWKRIFSVRSYTNRRRFECAFEPVQIKHFRLFIHRSASKQWVNAAQVSEIELLPN